MQIADVFFSKKTTEVKMKTLGTILFLGLLLTTNEQLFSQTFEYVSPRNNSILVSLNTNIILKSDEVIAPSSLYPGEFAVTGSISGTHQGTVKLSDDNETVLFFPTTPFSPNEDVIVNVIQHIKTTDGKLLPPVTIHFRTTPLSQRININPLTLIDDGQLSTATYKSALTNATRYSVKGSPSTNELPSDFPTITVDTSNDPSTGKIFLTNFSLTPNDSIGNYLMILNNDGSVARYKRISEMGVDFKVQPNGELSYADITGVIGTLVLGRYIVLDTTLTPIDTLQCGNGYTTYPSDFLLLPNGHALVMGMDAEPYDMSQYGGSPNATIVGDVIQELDASKNVIFQWRTLDFIPITDSYIDLTTPTVDLIHANAFDVDQDGNILFSMRHLSSIFKIDRQTGNIDWILGGKENQFSFINEDESNGPNYFSFQHDVRLLTNGDLTLFDNGNQHVPNYSRAVEYRLDEQNKTATLVWQYRHTPDIYGYAMGSVQRLSNGNTLIGWGLASLTGSPMFTEVHPDNITALEFSLPSGQASYRAYRLPWVSETPEASVTVGNGSAELLQGNTYKFSSLNDTTGVTIKFDQLKTAPYPTATISMYDYAPVDPTFATNAPKVYSNYFNLAGGGIDSYSGDVQVNLQSYPAITDPGETIVYARSGSNATFTPMPTSFDSSKDELTFTTSTLGDFAFGVPQTIDSAYAPVPISPTDSEIVNEEGPVNLAWGTRGTVQTYHLQVSTNASFGNLVVDNSNLSSTSFTMSTVSNNATYYWRVNNTNAAGTSAWSNVETFITAAPFISVLSPNGGETTYLDSAFVIRWGSNVADTVNIVLIDGNKTVSVIADSIFSGTSAIQWRVPSNLQPDSNYKIMITSISDASLSDLSNSPFTISAGVTGVSEISNSPQSYELYQNYPNPFNPTTVISYQLPANSHVTLKVYDILGNLVKALVDANKKGGKYSVNFDGDSLSSGVYFYELRTDGYVSVKKMILLK